ncbi:MAG TPA: hypothetical protein PK225_15570, partial [Azonexus sp.]|nr:hypothetical protein [Azonexus sp.]
MPAGASEFNHQGQNDIATSGHGFSEQAVSVRIVTLLTESDIETDRRRLVRAQLAKQARMPETRPRPATKTIETLFVHCDDQDIRRHRTPIQALADIEDQMVDPDEQTAHTRRHSNYAEQQSNPQNLSAGPTGATIRSRHRKGSLYRRGATL